MSDWNPALYARFEDERTRPAAELLAPGGVRAVQMPDNLDEPSHTLMRATGLKPHLDPLTPELQRQFLAEYQRRIELAYPVRADGKRLLAFPRLFIVARRRDG